MLEDNATCPAIYLNFAATSYPKSSVALQAFHDAVSALPRGIRSGFYRPGVLQQARREVASLLNVSESTVFFTAGATLGLNQVIFGHCKPGDTIMFDNRSHNAVVRAFYNKVFKLRGRSLDLYDRSDAVCMKTLRAGMAIHPELLCLTHASSVTGSIYPIGDIIQETRRCSPNTAILVDASQTAGAVDLQEIMAADFVVFPGHKHIHAVSGAAVIVTRRPLRPYILGGTGKNSLNVQTHMDDELFAEVGTINEPAIASLAAAMRFAQTHLAKHAAHEKTLHAALLAGLESVDILRPIVRPANPKRRLPVASFITLRGTPENDWVPYLRAQNIVVRGGLHCSPLIHQQFGVERVGTLRLSIGWATTQDDIEVAVEALKEFAAYV